jgi:hypothetical protein
VEGGRKGAIASAAGELVEGDARRDEGNWKMDHGHELILFREQRALHVKRVQVHLQNSTHCTMTFPVILGWIEQ